MEDGSMLYNPIEPKREDVIEIVKAAYYRKDKPLKVSDDDLKSAAEKAAGDKAMKAVFKDSDQLYDVLVGFYELLKDDAELGPALSKTGLCVQFVYKNPSATITIDATGDELKIIAGDSAVHRKLP